MYRSASLFFMTLVLLLVSTTGCTAIKPAQIEQPTSIPTVISLSPTPEALPLPTATSAPAFPSDGWITYTDSQYGFSVSYPANFEINLREYDFSFYIGEKIHVWITEVNPLECQGDLCGFVESVEPATVAGLEATKVTGYIGNIGGNIAQRYIKYIFQQDNRYYSFTLYALSFKAVDHDPFTLWPLSENDIALFEQILKTFKFTN